MFFFFLFLSFLNIDLANSNEIIFSCQTQKQSGLDFLGKDYDEIVTFLGLKTFKVKFSRSRDDIVRSLKSNKKLSLKSSHFIDLTIIKSNSEIEGMNCSWRFDIRYDRKEDRLFTCMDRETKTKVFDIDFAGNFVYSSSFPEFYYVDKEKKDFRSTLHSLFGKCIEKKNN